MARQAKEILDFMRNLRYNFSAKLAISNPYFVPKQNRVPAPPAESEPMITIHTIEEMFAFYVSLGGKRERTLNGFFYRFPGNGSYIRFWGDLGGFSAASADFLYPEDVVIRTQLTERYLGVGFSETGSIQTYQQKNQARRFDDGCNCYVYNDRFPFFMRVTGGQRLRFTALYFQESFFIENHIALPDSFWQDAQTALGAAPIHLPELISVYRQIEGCRLSGPAFALWMRGQGFSALGYLIRHVQNHAKQQSTLLRQDEKAAVEHAKALLKQGMEHPPTLAALCRQVGLNKNKLQVGFRNTEGKSAAEYLRAIRMERALALLEDLSLPIVQIAAAVGYRGKSNFYQAFSQTFGATPAEIRQLLACPADVPSPGAFRGRESGG